MGMNCYGSLNCNDKDTTAANITNYKGIENVIDFG